MCVDASRVRVVITLCSGTVRGPLARVAEWQTRWLQVPVRATSWGFKSPLAHKKSLATQGTSSRPGVDFHRQSHNRGGNAQSEQRNGEECPRTSVASQVLEELRPTRQPSANRKSKKNTCLVPLAVIETTAPITTPRRTVPPYGQAMRVGHGQFVPSGCRNRASPPLILLIVDNQL